MKNLVRTAAILSGVLGLSGVAAALAVGCGGDDTVIGYPGDSGGDGQTVDATSDTSIGDSGPDTSFHFDAGPTDLSSFYHQIDETACAWEQNCCGGPTAFDTAACIKDLDDPTSAGFMFTRTLSTVPDGGRVTFDEAKATQCLTLIQGLSCSMDPSAITSAQSLAIRDACYGAITGTIPVGSTGCTGSIECVPPAHCEATGGGTCVAPYDAGAPCAINAADPTDSIYRCGRAYEGTPNYCEVGDYYTLKEAGTCAPQQPIGASCYTPIECASWTCDFNSDLCANSYAIINTGLCTAYPPDAGDGG